jgi:hypothetical protein
MHESLNDEALKVSDIAYSSETFSTEIPFKNNLRILN